MIAGLGRSPGELIGYPLQYSDLENSMDCIVHESADTTEQISLVYALRAPLFQKGSPGGSEVKVSASNSGDPGLIPGSGRFPGEGNGNRLQYSRLGNPMDRGAWRAMVYGVTKSWT